MDGWADWLKTPEGQGLLSAAFAGLAGARRGQPVNSIGRAGMAGLLGYGQALERADLAGQRAAAQEFRELQMEQMRSQMEAARRAQEEAESAKASRQEYLGALTGGATPTMALQGGGGPTVANAQRIGQPVQFDPLSAVRAGFSIDEVSKLGDLGKRKVKEYREVRIGDRVEIVGFDEYGQPVTTGQTPFKAAEVRDFGGYVGGVDPITGKVTQYGPKTMSPSEKDASARGWATVQQGRERLDFDKSQPKGQYDPARGVLVDTRTGEARPVTVNGQPIESPLKPMTEAQAKANLFGSRAQESNRVLAQLAAGGTELPGQLKQMAEGVPFIGGVLGTGINALPGVLGGPNAKQQQVEQAQRDFINAVLRRESGAVIADSEFENARRQYFPQPGDSEAVKAQKARNRELAIRGILVEVPEAHRLTPPANGPKPGTVQDGYRFKGGNPADPANWERAQ